jgi:hypothetical protein
MNSGSYNMSRLYSSTHYHFAAYEWAVHVRHLTCHMRNVVHRTALRYQNLTELQYCFHSLVHLSHLWLF